MRPVPRQKPQRLHPFEVLLKPTNARTPVMLRTACDANRATLAFHAEWQRLTEQQIDGDLLLVYHDEQPRTLLRDSLG